MKLKRMDQVMILIDATVGVWWGFAYAFIFFHLQRGGAINEPTVLIANTEFAFSVVLALWFIYQMIYWLSKVKL